MRIALRHMVLIELEQMALTTTRTIHLKIRPDSLHWTWTHDHVSTMTSTGEPIFKGKLVLFHFATLRIIIESIRWTLNWTAPILLFEKKSIFSQMSANWERILFNLLIFFWIFIKSNFFKIYSNWRIQKKRVDQDLLIELDSFCSLYILHLFYFPHQILILNANDWHFNHFQSNFTYMKAFYLFGFSIIYYRNFKFTFFFSNLNKKDEKL